MNYLNYDIGRYCFTFRRETLGMTLQEFSEKTRVPLKTISAFENGRSSNMNILLKYVLQTSIQSEMQSFYDRITYITREHELMVRGLFQWQN